MKINNISVGYGGDPVLDGVTLTFNNSEISAVIGPNGTGKSTLLKALCGFLPLQHGSIEIEGRDLKLFRGIELAREVALIPQEVQMQFDYKVFDLVMMGRYPYLDFWQTYRKEDHLFVDHLLSELDLKHYEDKFYSQLSGGEKQRVSIARALAQDTKYILMDESFSHLDINHQIEIMELLQVINQSRGKTLILVSHNLNLAAEYCDRIILLNDGKVFADGEPSNVITARNLKEVYGVETPIMNNPTTGNPYVLYPGRQ